MKTFIKVTKALSDPNRVKILKMLQRSPMFVSEMHDALGISQPAVSRHLKILEDADLVTFRKEGTWVRYSMSDGANNPYAASILGNFKHWLEHPSGIDELQARVLRIDRRALPQASGHEDHFISVQGV